MTNVQNAPAAASMAASGSRPAKLVCRGLWKLFGADAERVLERTSGHPSAQQIAEAGLIGAVRDADLDVGEGEVFVIMGLSGSGKSTIVRCLSRLIEPTAGELLFEGADLRRANARQLTEIRRHKMGMVFQHFALLPHLSVLGNVAFPLEIQGVPRGEREARAMEVIELVGLSGRETYFPRELSGGQQQRVGIARSLVVKPEIWFLDEPFSALDPLIRREMQDEFLRLQRVLHTTIVFITHDFDEAIRLADRIAIMKDGEIVQIGSPEEVVTAPATQYVAEFTRDVPRAKVMSVRALMTPGGAEGTVGTVHADDRVNEVAHQAVHGRNPVAVVDDAGTVIGRLERAPVVDVLAPDGGPDPAQAKAAAAS